VLQALLEQQIKIAVGLRRFAASSPRAKSTGGMHRPKKNPAEKGGARESLEIVDRSADAGAP
jgi:hypothetical protein